MCRILRELVIACILSVSVGASGSCREGACRPAPRVAGGVPSERNSRPFQVALYLRAGPSGEVGFCGGALLHPQWVLTAAHCCFHDDQLVDNVQAILGAHSLYDRYEHGRRVVAVAETVVHPDWRPDAFRSDLALLRLANTVQLTATINTVRLPYLRIAENNFAGVGATASGWGIPASGVAFVSPTLRQNLMTVMVDSMCNSSYHHELPDNLLCGFSQRSGTCKGDNGGPLTIFFSQTEEIILIGVTTFISSSGCNDNLPSAFTRVQRHLDWISDVTGIPLE